MLSVGKVTTGQGGYYLEAVAHGREDYYTNSGEVLGRWLGAGSVTLGLDGEVETTTSSQYLPGSHLSMASGCLDRTGECRDST